jgi:hypothetical protein
MAMAVTVGRTNIVPTVPGIDASLGAAGVGVADGPFWSSSETPAVPACRRHRAQVGPFGVRRSPGTAQGVRVRVFAVPACASGTDTHCIMIGQAVRRRRR